MNLDYLKLKNFRSVIDFEFNFRDGFNLISGRNGAGKSSVQLGLAYLLYNHTIKSIDDYVNWDANGFDIVSRFRHNAKNYDIEVNRAKKKTKKKLAIDKDVFLDSDVDNKLAQDFDTSLSKSSFLAFQGENDLISATPASRREMLKKIYDLDFKEQLSKLDEEKKELETQEKENNDKYLMLKGKEFRLLEMSEPPYSEEEHQKHITDLELIKKELENLRLKQSIIEKRIDDNNKDITNCNNTLQDLEINKVNILSRINIKKEKIEKDRKEIVDLKFKLESKSYEDKLKEYKSEISGIILTRIIGFNDTLLKNSTDEMYFLKNSKQNLEERIELLEQGKCPTCGGKFDSNDLIQVQEDLLDIEKQILENHRTRDNEIDLQRGYESAFSLNEKLKNNKLTLEAQIKGEEEKIILIVNQYNDKIESLDESILEDKKSIVENNETLSKIIIDSEQCLKELNEFREVKEEIDKELSSDKEDISNILIKEIIDFENRISDQDKAIATNKQLVLENEKIEASKKENKKKLIELEKLSGAITTSIDVLKEANDIYKKRFPNYVINLMLKSIENGMNDFLSKTYEGRYTVKIQESKQGIEIVYGKKNASASLASGSEKDLMNIGLKIAYNKLAGLKVLFLDEIDHMMSIDIAKKVFNTIYDMYEANVFNQVFIISHKPEIKEMIKNEYRAKVFEIL